MFNERLCYSVRSIRFATRFDRYSVYVSSSTSLLTPVQAARKFGGAGFVEISRERPPSVDMVFGGLARPQNSPLELAFQIVVRWTALCTRGDCVVALR
eukprot:12983678-Alexandrium_andersonii.AAC.1